MKQKEAIFQCVYMAIIKMKHFYAIYSYKTHKVTPSSNSPHQVTARLTFPIPYANLFYRSQRSDNISKSNDEESSLPDILQRNPGGRRLRAAASDAERDGWKAGEHGFRAAHRTMDMNCGVPLITHGKAAKGPPFTAGECGTGTR